ncbi:acyltransferase [Plesiomonas shigelloides]|uniref:acyltransferase n=1 Tax=Plesiomonas shigelloides TaxID=703 RepID=UPI000D11A907|nr:acyltransferase [Plesiomonas shigelloides]AVQ87626.1 acyltransferase [Plesiomonas shigelloides]
MRFAYWLINSIFRVIKKLVRKSKLHLAIKQGLVVGSETLLIGTQEFGSEPYLVRIGCQCLITDGVRFITHDGSIQVPLIKNGANIKEVYSKKSTFGRIEIGDNVFIGVASIILPNTKISNDSIVAAGSVVKGSFEEGVVIGGNPAKVICNIDEYFSRNGKCIIDISSVNDRKREILKVMEWSF